MFSKLLLNKSSLILDGANSDGTIKFLNVFDVLIEKITLTSKPQFFSCPHNNFFYCMQEHIIFISFSLSLMFK